MSGEERLMLAFDLRESADVSAKLRLALSRYFNLLSPRDNPGHYWLPGCGIALSGLFMLPFAGYLQRHLQMPRHALHP